jgi:hypothetical protein
VNDPLQWAAHYRQRPTEFIELPLKRSRPPQLAGSRRALARVSPQWQNPHAHTRNDEAANSGGLDTSAGLDRSAVYFPCTFFHTFTGDIGPSGVSTLLPVSVIVSP